MRPRSNFFIIGILLFHLPALKCNRAASDVNRYSSCIKVSWPKEIFNKRGNAPNPAFLSGLTSKQRETD